MEQKLLKRKPRKVAPGRAVSMRPPQEKVVLVGTYKGKQLERWTGYYNYPLSEDEFLAAENAKSAKKGRAVAPRPPQSPDARDDAASANLSTVQPFKRSTLQRVNELWLFQGAKAGRFYSAEYVGIFTRDELKEKYGYPATGKAHGERYVLYKTSTTEIYNPASGIAEVVIVRATDFATAPKVRKQIKAYLESPDRNDPIAAKLVPKILTQVPREVLRVCEAAVQLEFWANEAVCGYFSSQTVLSQTESVSISFQNDLGTLYLGDSLRWLKGLPSSSVDMIFADPPYSIGKADWDCFSSHEDYLAWCEVWVEQAARILKPTGTCYICGFSEILADVKYRTQHFFNGCRWIVWHYKNKANLGSDWGRSHESLLHFRKAKTTVLNVDDIRIPYNAHTLRYPAHPQADSSAYAKSRATPTVAQWRPNEKGAKPKDVFDIPTTCNGMGEKTPHPTQKPEELVRKLVLASSNEGDLVLDPFSGSGTTAVVAQQLHRHWLACDKVPEYNQWAVQRLSHVPVYPVQYWIELDREVAKRRESIR